MSGIQDRLWELLRGLMLVRLPFRVELSDPGMPPTVDADTHVGNQSATVTLEVKLPESF